MKITKEITLDVSRLNRFQSIIAKQNDKDSRYLKVSVADEGNVLIIPSSAKVTITATRPDNFSSSFLGEVNEDGKAIVPLSPWMLELDGSLSCEVSIITEESVLKTTSFNVDVEPDESSGNTDVTQDPNYDILVELIQEVAGVAAVEKEAISIAVDAYLHEKNIRPLQRGTDYWTEADKAEITAQVQAVCIAKNQGASNVGKILVVGTDGNLTLADMPEGGASGDVVGTLDESNNILLSGNLADGTYTLKYENADGTYTEIGTLEVGAETEVTIIGIVAEKTKTTYTAGDTLDTSDITLTINYSDGTSGNITSGFIVDTSMVQMNTVGNYNIVVSYEGFSSNIAIVVEKAPEVYSGYDVYELFGYTDSSRLGSSSIYNGTASGYVLTGAIPLTELVGKTITIRTKGLSYAGGGGVWGIMSDNSMSASYVKRGVCSDSTIWQDIQLSYNEPDANGIASFTMLIPETYAEKYLRISAMGAGATSQVTIDREITA